MTPREFRQEKEFEFDHFIELTSTGIKPNYVNIELFAQEYHQAKLKLSTTPCERSWINTGMTLQGVALKRCMKCGKTEQTVS